MAVTPLKAVLFASGLGAVEAPLGMATHVEWAKPLFNLGVILLWVAALLTVVTGWDYLRVGLKHMD